MNGVPYRPFEKWFRSTRKEIVPIQIDGLQEQDTSPVGQEQSKTDSCERPLGRILVMVHIPTQKVGLANVLTDCERQLRNGVMQRN